MRIIDRIHQLLAQGEDSFHLEGEGLAQPIIDPRDVDIRRELERLRSSGPSFLALIASNGSYVQAAGNAKRMTTEAHLVTSKRTAHVVLGRYGAPGAATTVVSSSGSIVIRASEVWSALEAADLFSAFATTASIPPILNQRDITTDIALT